MPTFSDDDLVELSLLRAKEVDELVEHGLLDTSRRFDEELLDIIALSYPELRVSLHTGPTYPAEQLQLEIENISLPRLTVDELRSVAREIVVRDTDTNNYEGWSRRSYNDDFGIFQFEMTAFHVAQAVSEQLVAYRHRIKLPREESIGAEDRGAAKYVISNSVYQL